MWILSRAMYPRFTQAVNFPGTLNLRLLMLSQGVQQLHFSLFLWRSWFWGIKILIPIHPHITSYKTLSAIDCIACIQLPIWQKGFQARNESNMSKVNVGNEWKMKLYMIWSWRDLTNIYRDFPWWDPYSHTTPVLLPSETAHHWWSLQIPLETTYTSIVYECL